MGKVIAISNQKGGVGKTTTAVNLGASLAAAERRTLVVDMDPQSNATSGFGVTYREMRASLYGVLLDHQPVGDAIHRGLHGLSHLDLLPTTIDLSAAEPELARARNGRFRLREVLDQVRNLYDYVLIDCSPALGLLTLNALIAAETVLVPLQTEFYALEGIAQFREGLGAVRQHLNPRLEIEGVVLTMYDGRLKLAREVAAEARSYFEGGVFQTVIPRNIALAEAPSFGQPALVYDISSRGAQAYLALALELIRYNEGRSAALPLDAAGVRRRVALTGAGF